MDFFGPPSIFQESVDKATSDFLVSPDWSLNLTICDTVNAAPDEAPKEILRAIKKRLKEKNPKIQLLSLTLLEALVKNCTHSLHQALGTNKEFLETMVKLTSKDIKKLTTAEVEVREKALELIQTWAETFQRFAHRMPAFNEVYEGLRKKGVEFPARGSDDTAPIFTPPVTSPVPSYSPVSQPSPAAPRPQPPRPQTTSTNSTGGANAKIHADLAAVEENVSLLMELVGAATPEDDLTKNDLVQELMPVVKEMHRRVLTLIQEMPDESLLGILLDINDRITRVFDLYADRTSSSSGRKTAPAPTSEAPSPSVPVYQDQRGLAPSTPQPTAPPSVPQQQPAFSIDDLLGAPIDVPPLVVNNGLPQNVPPMGSPYQVSPPAANLATGMASLTLSPPTMAATVTATNVPSRQIAFDEDEDDAFDAIARRPTASPPSVRSAAAPSAAIHVAPPNPVPSPPKPVVRQSDDFDDFLASRLPATTPSAPAQQKLEKTNNDVFEL